MANQLYNSMNQPNNILQQFQQFRQNFKGDPQQTIQQLLNSGRITQEQYNRAMQTAQQYAKAFGIRY